MRIPLTSQLHVLIILAGLCSVQGAIKCTSLTMKPTAGICKDLTVTSKSCVDDTIIDAAQMAITKLFETLGADEAMCVSGTKLAVMCEAQGGTYNDEAIKSSACKGPTGFCSPASIPVFGYFPCKTDEDCPKDKLAAAGSMKQCCAAFDMASTFLCKGLDATKAKELKAAAAPPCADEKKVNCWDTNGGLTVPTSPPASSAVAVKATCFCGLLAAAVTAFAMQL